MPLPKPNEDEDKADFMERCMSNPTMNEEYPENAQRFAVCQGLWDDNKQIILEIVDDD